MISFGIVAGVWKQSLSASILFVQACWIFCQSLFDIPPWKSNMPKNAALEKVTPF